MPQYAPHSDKEKRQKKLFGTAVAFLLPPECAQLRKAKDIPNIETINDLHFPGIWFIFFFFKGIPSFNSPCEDFPRRRFYF